MDGGRAGRIAVVLALTALTLVPEGARAEVVDIPVSFAVANPLEPGVPREIHGFLYRRADQAACTSSVTLLVHGLSYGIFGWDLRVGDKVLSVARDLAAQGYPAVAIDLLGYGSSDGYGSPNRPNGYTLTVQSYAVMVGQIVDQLRDGGYQGTRTAFARVGLAGHSAGTEISELAVGSGLADVDLLVATGYTHFPSERIATDFITGDMVRASQSDYEYFGGSEAVRTEYMYDVRFADRKVIAADNARANLTPSGEIYSIGPQPSKLVMGAIDVPVLLVLAANDLLFPIKFADEELSLFASSADRTLLTVPDAGHSFMLHDNAAQTNAAIANWLVAPPSRLPAC